MRISHRIARSESASLPGLIDLDEFCDCLRHFRVSESRKILFPVLPEAIVGQGSHLSNAGLQMRFDEGSIKFDVYHRGAEILHGRDGLLGERIDLRIALEE